jgi:hypothetical protein
MKPRVVTFKHPVKVIQVYRNQQYYGKDEKSYETRRDALAWQPIPSATGYVKDGTLYLPPGVQESDIPAGCNLLIFTDNNQRPAPKGIFMELRIGNHYGDRTVYMGYVQHFLQYDFLQFRMAEPMELHLCLQDVFGLITPVRPQFKLCELEPGQQVLIKLNGKNDFSASGRRGRTFMEWEYIIDYLGDFSSCTILPEPHAPIIKHAPQPDKIIDLIKPLW